MQDKFRQTIKDFLTKTRNRCYFKKAFLPKGWTCIQINKFAKELAKKLGGK